MSRVAGSASKPKDVIAGLYDMQNEFLEAERKLLDRHKPLGMSARQWWCANSPRAIDGCALYLQRWYGDGSGPVFNHGKRAQGGWENGYPADRAFENNRPMRRIMESPGSIPCETCRVYEKALT